MQTTTQPTAPAATPAQAAAPQAPAATPAAAPAALQQTQAGTVPKAKRPQAKAAPKANAIAKLAASLAAAPKGKASAAPATVALRGGPAVAVVRLTGAAYRTGAPHNAQWWATIGAAIATGNGQAAVAPLLLTPANPQGVPAAFFTYTMRRGYLAPVAGK